jgi:plastocyanin
MSRRALALAVVLVSAAACGGDDGGTEDPAEECVDLTTQGDSFTVTMSGLEFVPACFTASASQRLTLVNEDGALHSFTIEGTAIDVDIAGGETLDLSPVSGQVAPGKYELICKYHLPSMSGSVTIAAPVSP